MFQVSAVERQISDLFSEIFCCYSELLIASKVWYFMNQCGPVPIYFCSDHFIKAEFDITISKICIAQTAVTPVCLQWS